MACHSNLSDICKSMADFIFALDMLQFFLTLTKNLGCTRTMRSFRKASISLFCAVSRITGSLKIYMDNALITFIFSPVGVKSRMCPYAQRVVKGD